MPSSERKIAIYLRRTQGADMAAGRCSTDGDFDMSASVKAYFALKTIGDRHRCAAHGARARGDALARRRGASPTCSPSMMLALFGFIPWRAVPVMPVEIMLLPRWFPFHLDKISYWSRTVIVPLLVLMALKPRARNPKNIRIDELFLEPPQTLGPAPKAPQQKAAWFWFFRVRRQRAARDRAAISRRERGSARSTRRWPGSASGSTARTVSARSSRRWRTA